MTAQISDILVNKHPRVRLGRLRLYGIIRGDPHTNNGWVLRYKFKTSPKPPKDAPRCSALWRGYVATFRLGKDGELKLVSYQYPLSLTKAMTEEVNEKLTGDFWLVMKPKFIAPRTYVPFKDGRIVEDSSVWIREITRSWAKEAGGA